MWSGDSKNCALSIILSVRVGLSARPEAEHDWNELGTDYKEPCMIL